MHKVVAFVYKHSCLEHLYYCKKLDSNAKVNVHCVQFQTLFSFLSNYMTTIFCGCRLLATVPSPVLEKGKAIATAYMDQSATFDEANPDFTVIQGGDSELLKGLL